MVHARRRSYLLLERWNLVKWWLAMFYGAMVLGWVAEKIGEFD
jgi:hypothetical protein